MHVPLTENQPFEDMWALSHCILQTQATNSVLEKCSLTLGLQGDTFIYP